MTSNKHAYREALLKMIDGDFSITRGHPLPIGATVVRGGVNFSVISESAGAMSILLFVGCAKEPLVEFPLDPAINKTGHIWHAHIQGLDPWINYAWKVYADEPGLTQGEQLIDPYTRVTCGGGKWGHPLKTIEEDRFKIYRLSTVTDDSFDWEHDRPLGRPLQDTIIYELHVRGFTRHESASVNAPGTFKGIIEKIPYLQELGVTAVELMPVTDFDETDNPRRNPLTGERLYNYWGYDPLNFFAVKEAYASGNSPAEAIREFKTMVRELHKAGIEVILDMVFNHTAEGNEHGPIYNFKGLDRDTYYLYDRQKRHYLNYSGCGNTVNCNHPTVRTMILDSLRYWVTEMHVDGFRFDLASIMSRGARGEVLSDPPILERIALDPVLAHTKIIAEAWDAAGLYQVGSFPHWQRWMEWNGRFRDDVRRFIRGDRGMTPALARRLAGSADLYQDDGREPYHSVNFVSCHDGFPLADLVMYSEKHNLANGENNRDGENHNISFNYGVEGPSDDPDLTALRNRQVLNMAALLLLAQGVPMFHMGDEMGRTQQGNNNAYCQDNAISWLNWDFLNIHKPRFLFFKRMIAFRKAHPHLRRRRFEVHTVEGRPEMSWHGTRVMQPDWSDGSRCLGVWYAAKSYPVEEADDDIYIMINGSLENRAFELPHLPHDRRWFRFADTADVRHPAVVPGEEKEAPDQHVYNLTERSVVVLVSRRVKV